MAKYFDVDLAALLDKLALGEGVTLNSVEVIHPTTKVRVRYDGGGDGFGRESEHKVTVTVDLWVSRHSDTTSKE
jgi:hypothetical protein